MKKLYWWDTIKIVKAKNVSDYLRRYYKPSRMTPTLLQTYKDEYDRHGYVCTSNHDNVLGIFIAWPSRKAIAKVQGHCKPEEEGK